MAIANLLKNRSTRRPTEDEPEKDNAQTPGGEERPVLSFIERLESDALAAAAAFDIAKDNYSSALTDAAEGTLDGAHVTGYRTAYEMARDHLMESEMVLSRAKEREAARQIDQAREHTKEAWLAAVDMSEKRLEALNQLSEAASTFAAAWIAVEKANEELFAALPAQPDLDAAKMRLPTLADLIKREMARLGVSWAHDMSPSLLITQEPFAQTMAATPGVIRAWHDRYTRAN